jgi:uncharacterized protein
VYQATFQEGPWGGRADFLVRVERPSLLGNFCFEVAETKLARSAKARAILQLCFYSELLSKTQDAKPEWMHVVLGGPEKFLVSHYIAFFRKVKRDFEQALRNLGYTYPEPVDLCDVCDRFPLCDKRRHDDDHLSITKLQRKELALRRTDRVAQWATLTDSEVRMHWRCGAGRSFLSKVQIQPSRHSYFAASCGGAPISIVRQYIQLQKTPYRQSLS